MIRLLIPWLLFPYLIEWLHGNFAGAALLVALSLVILCFDNLRKRRVIEVTLLACLLVMAAVAMLSPTLCTFENMKAIVYGALAVIGWVGVLRGQPFTRQYSEDDVDEAARQSAAFFEINNLLTKVWCLTFSVNAVLAASSLYFEHYWPVFLMGSYLSLLVASVITQVFPETYFSRRASAHE